MADHDKVALSGVKGLMALIMALSERRCLLNRKLTGKAEW